MPQTVLFCPDCRNRAIRRRRRSGIALWVASFFGQWPYHCEECGLDFLLTKRYLRPRDRDGHLVKPSSRRAATADTRRADGEHLAKPD